MNSIRSHGIYRHACPNCRGEEDDGRLFLGAPCFKCFPREVESRISIYKLYDLLRNYGSLKEVKELFKLHKGLDEVDELFHKATGSRLWSIQRTWVKRVLKGRSFTIIAPTGVGKTVFGMIMALFLALKGKKAYIIEPTTPLVLQVYNRLISFADKAGLDVQIIAYHARLKPKIKSEVLSKISNGDFDILITTSRFLTARFDALKGKHFHFIFVDDVDAILKSSKNIDRILSLLGFTDDEIADAYELVKLRNRITKLISLHRKSPEIKELMENYDKLVKRVAKIKGKSKSILVVSSATGRPRGLRVKLFRELLGFDVGSRSELLRNVVDVYCKVSPEKSIEEMIVELASNLGSGGLVFVPVDKGLEYAEKLAEILVESGIKAEAFSSKNIEALSRFIEGESDVLVGVAYYYGVMVRGLDLPDKVRYALFAGIPKFKFNTKLDEPHPSNILRGLTIISEVVEGIEEKRRIERLIARVRRYMQILPVALLNEIGGKLAEGIKPSTDAERVFYEALQVLRSYLARSDIKDKLKKLEDVRLIEENGKTFILIPDVMTYIQASGRTSRMFAGGLTKGLSIVVVDDEHLLKGLMKRAKWIIEDMEWRSLEEVDIKSIIDEIDRDRLAVKQLREGKIRMEFKDPMKTALMVVESPNKARTIANFFGKPSVRRFEELKVYEVSTGELLLMITASGGHIYDLVTDVGYHGVLLPKDGGAFLPVYTAIRRCLKCGYQFSDDLDKCPKCGSSVLRNSLKVIDFIRALCEEVDLVLIGTDPDTEGEKIGWDLAALLTPYAKEVKRIEFHEVTKRAILEALRSARSFDTNLVEAQIVRRVEDRWIGFELSKRLWSAFKRRGLSAGRVQTPVLGWIIEREREFKESFKNVYSILLPYGIKVELTEDEVLEKLVKAELVKAKIKVLDVVEEDMHPPPPYTTDTYLHDASKKLRLTAPEAMQIAQDLFELGFITYHRTDSTRVSTFGQYVAKEYLSEKFGAKAEELYMPRSWGEAGAHECIRPTRPLDVNRVRELIAEGIITPIKPLTKRHFLAYDMIFKRFIASQMKAAKVVRQKIELSILGVARNIDRIIKVKEPGFLTVNPIVRVEVKVEEGEVKPVKVDVRRKALVTLYTHGDVIRLMKERGIGRPSTYAKIVQTLIQRGYVMETKRKKLMPTKLGKSVYRYLASKYGNLVSEKRTAMLEEIMDQIERGERNYIEVLSELYREISSIP
ncbi:MAG: reverse gyrase [archaeon GB-1867-005]|nr:reverse gyrase [Candidatus Culexmicrobium cathedralense]